FLIYPAIRGFYMSLHKWTIIRKMDFIKFDNYTRLFNNPSFWGAVRNTLFFVAVSTPAIVIFGLILALICNSKLKGNIVLKTTFFLPYVLSVSIISTVMVYFFQTHSGFINTFLVNIGIPRVDWLGSRPLAWFVLVFATLWWTVGFNMILFLSSLQDIPESYYEAARVDGASRSVIFWKITLPLLEPITWTIVLLQIIFSAKVFAQVRLITGGGPGSSTRSLVQYLYQEGFSKNNLGYASAISVVFLVALMIFSIVFQYVKNRRLENHG
ncbi:MAG: carbohydrate ABC transporter permease, partial [Halanaerobium sp.]